MLSKHYRRTPESSCPYSPGAMTFGMVTLSQTNGNGCSATVPLWRGSEKPWAQSGRYQAPSAPHVYLLGPHVVPLGEGGRVVSNSIFKVVYPHRNPRRASCGQTDGWAGGSCYITPRVGHKRLCTCRLSTRWKMEKVEKVVLKRRQVIS